jgi:hypothetical protein
VAALADFDDCQHLKHSSRKSLIVCSLSAAAILMALMSSRPSRTCSGDFPWLLVPSLDVGLPVGWADFIVAPLSDRLKLHATMLSCSQF